MGIPSSVLNTNIASIIAQRNLAGAQESLATSVERLSSGLRINRAKDDASGMAVASVIKSQISIASRAHQNINDAVSMIQTGEGALQEGAAMLTRIKELATQGANDSMSKEQYYFLIQEMKQLMEELRNVAARTTFNGNNLLGTFTTGSSVETGDTTKIKGTPSTGQNGPWQFLSGAGRDDFVQIDLIPIWASRTEALDATNDVGYGEGAVKVGALNALYTRIAWLAQPANSPATGRGYDYFSLAPAKVVTTLDSDGNSVTQPVDGGPIDASRTDNGDGEDGPKSAGAPGTLIIPPGGEYSSDAVSARNFSLNDLVDEAILQINAHRSYFGAYAGRLEHNVANLAAQTENLTAALSRVQDTDYGAETANLTRVQILQQAATAMLAQANAMPNVILGLLRQQ
jgi:flagellin